MAKSARQSVSVTIGRRYGNQLSNEGTLAGKAIEQHLMQKVRDRSATTFIAKNAPDLAELIARRIENELSRVGAFIATHLIGKRSIGFNDSVEIEIGEEDPEGNGFEQVFVEWKTLAKNTVTQKSRTYGGAGNQFFKGSGALAGEIRSKVGPGLVRLNAGRTGKKNTKTEATVNGVTVKLKQLNPGEKRARYHLADVRVELLPGVRTSSIARAVTGRGGGSAQLILERRLGLSAGSLRKLAGPVSKKNGALIPDLHRPLVQPTLQYFLQFRIPRAIEKAVQSTRRKGPPS